MGCLKNIVLDFTLRKIHLQTQEKKNRKVCYGTSTCPNQDHIHTVLNAFQIQDSILAAEVLQSHRKTRHTLFLIPILSFQFSVKENIISL